MGVQGGISCIFGVIVDAEKDNDFDSNEATFIVNGHKFGDSGEGYQDGSEEGFRARAIGWHEEYDHFDGKAIIGIEVGEEAYSGQVSEMMQPKDKTQRNDD